MNEQAILDSYNLFVQNGYSKSLQEYKALISSNQEALQDSYNLFVSNGYGKSVDEFKGLMGLNQPVKKKEVALPPSPKPNTTELPLGIGSLEFAKPSKPAQEGPTEKLAVGPMGITGLERTKEYVPASDQGKQGTILNTVSSLDKGFYKNLIGSPVKGLGTALEGVTGKGFVSDALIKFGDYFNKTIDELTPQDEEFKNSLTDQFGQAFGQVASLVATSGAAGLASKAPTAAAAAKSALAAQTAPTAAGAVSALKTLGSELASPTAVSAGLSMGQGEFERAKAAGATDEQAFEAFYKNAAVGSVLEKIPVMQFLKRFEKASAGGISNYIKTKSVAGLTGGLEEMTTEVLQGIYGNLTAQEIYNANQDLFEGIGEAGGVGFGVGFLLNAMGANAKILRKQGREGEAQVVENQMAQFESQAAKGGVSSYKISGVSVKSPEIINKMIDNMDATDLVRANIEIENDPELNNKLQDKIVTSSIKEQVRQGNPDLNETSLDAITNLELELRKLEGNTTQTGKDKAAAIRSQIKNIQENQLTEEVDNTARIAELEGILSSADSNLAETGFTSLSQDARVEIEKELQDLKTKQDVQKQTAGEVPVQSGTEVSGKVEEGKPQAKPEGVAEEGVQKEEVKVGSVIKWDVYGNEEEGDWNVVSTTTTKGGQPAVVLNKLYVEDSKTGKTYTKEYADKNNIKYINEPYTEEHIVPLADLKVTTEEGVQAEVAKEEVVPAPIEITRESVRSLTDEQLSAAYDEIPMNLLPAEEGVSTQDAVFEAYYKAKASGKHPELIKAVEDVVSLKTQEEPIPKYVKDVSVLITPATVRGFDKTTNRIKSLSIKYDNLVKQFSKSKDKKVLAKIKDLESQILDSAKKDVVDKVSKIDGVAVQFKDNKMGLWEKKFEPSFNMTISVSPQADTKSVSDLLFDFSEKYSQDAFILESDSDMVIDANSSMPLSEMGKDGLMHYPQLIYTFDTPITDEQLADISVALENNGLDAFNINNNEVKVSVIKTFTEDEQKNLDENEQRESREQDYNSKTAATAKSIYDILGSNAKGSLNIRVRKSSYQGAVNEGTEDQTRQYNRSDVFKEFKESSTKVEKLGAELSKLRQKQIELQKEGKSLSKEDATKLEELSKIVQPVVQRTFEANKKLYEEAKTEVEGIAKDAIKDVNATVSPFPIKRAERASVKAIRWYGSFTEKLGDGARVNIVVDTDADADKVFDSIDKKYPGDKELRRISTTTELGYPKRLIEIRTSNGTIAEIQVITNEAYLAKDGVQGFTGDENQKNTAKKKLQEIRNRLGWNIPDGLGHYFYEIQRDSNIEESLRDEAARLSDLYYDAFSNPKSILSESFIKDALKFKQRVDAADKSSWDAGNKGIAPKSLTDYKFKETAKKAKKKPVQAPVQEEPTLEEISEIDALLDLDIEDEDNMQIVLSALDKADKAITKRLRGSANEALLAIPLSTLQLVVKTLKTLVKGGMLLRDAIRKVSADNNISQQSVKDILNISEIQDGFNELMDKVGAMIDRQTRRGTPEARMISNIDTLVRNSEVYQNATDAQKKILEREARAKAGAPARRAPSIGRILGVLKDITNVSREDKLKIISQIRQLSKDAAKDLANEIRELAKTGKITAIQQANIISRFARVNVLNELSVSKFVDYMANVFANAEYSNQIDVAKSKLKTAKKNIATKIGIADGLALPLQRLFSINPTLIPTEYLERYLELVNMFSEKQAVLSLEEKSKVTKDVEAILSKVNEEQSLVDELSDRFNSFKDKVVDKDGNLDYNATIEAMLKDGVIDEKEAASMKKNKSSIVPREGKEKKTDEEIAKEKQELITVLKDTKVSVDGLNTQYERNLAERLVKLVSSDAVNKLSNNELKNLLKVLDNINNNYLPHYAQLMVEKLTAINNAKTLTSAIQKAVVAPLSGLYSRVKSLITRKGAISEMIRRNPLFNIDQLFGDYKTKDIFNAILNKAAEGESMFIKQVKTVQNILERAEEKVAKSFKLDANKTLMSKFKMMTYLIQLEYDSNQNSKQVNPSAEYLKATIKHIDEGKSQFGERDANMLQEILDKYTDKDGNIDNDKLYNSFNQAEKEAIKAIRDINESLKEKAEYTASIIRGDRINPLTNYVHLNVLHEHQPNDATSGVAFVNDYNDSMRPSTKAKSLIERTGKVSPLNFDVFASAQRGAKFVLMDYNLTEPIRTARKTLNQTIANFEESGRIPKEKREIINAIQSAFEEVVDNVLTNSFVTTSIADDVVDYINKQGYRSVLAGTGRFASELMSNIGFALIADPKAFASGIENRGVVMSSDAPIIMENVGSKQVNRIFPTDTLSGKLIDTNILQQASGVKGAKSKNPVANKIQQIWNLSGKKYVNAVELTADALISTPDKLIMRPMWFGSFANEFKKISGEKINFEKIASKDEAYMNKHKDAIEKAKNIADEKSVMTGSTENPFMGILKGTVKPNQSALLKAFNNFNNFMTKFLIFEFVTARTAVNAAIGNGSLTKKQGIALLGAVTTRMVVYTLLTQMLGSGLVGLVYGDEEEEDEKSFWQKLGQAFTSAFTSMIFGRDFGNATKTLVNYGLERANEEYLDFLREGEYDPYKDAIQFSIVPPEKKGKQRDLGDFLLNMGGAFGPTLKTADLITRKAFEEDKKEKDAIERQKKEISVRIPLEVLGNAGLVPLYKDIRKSVLKDIYKDLEKAESRSSRSQMGKEDMKKYFPDMYNELYGPGGTLYDVELIQKQMRKEKEKLMREMKDEMYNYTPK